MSDLTWGSHAPAAIEEGFERVAEIPEEYRTPEHFFMEEVEGKLYPIPRELKGVELGNTKKEDDYTLLENGAVISKDALVDPSAEIQTRAEIERGVRITGQTIIGYFCKIYPHSTIKNSTIGKIEVDKDRNINWSLTEFLKSVVGKSSENSPNMHGSVNIEDSEIASSVVIDSSVKLKGSKIGRFSWIGRSTSVQNSTVGSHSRIGRHVTILDSTLADSTNLDYQVKIKQVTAGSRLKVDNSSSVKNAQIGDEVTIGNDVVINGATLGEHVIIVPSASVKNGRKIKANTVVIKRDQKAAKEKK